MVNEKGQSLLELLVVITVTTIVISALVFATIATLRNADFARNQTQATKLAQEGIERVRVGRDRNVPFTGTFSINDGTVVDWQSSSLWGPASISSSCNPCYFKISATGSMQSIGSTLTGSELIPPAPAPTVFKRTVLMSDDANFDTEKTITVIVSWDDYSGSHESRLSTILRRL